MHGGARGSGGPKGAHNDNYKHGLYTAEANVQPFSRALSTACLRAVRAALSGQPNRDMLSLMLRET
jgi:hypothetical protein